MQNAADFNALLANVQGMARNKLPPQQPPLPQAVPTPPVPPPSNGSNIGTGPFVGGNQPPAPAPPSAQPPNSQQQPQPQQQMDPGWQQFLTEISQDPNALGFLFAMGQSMTEPTDEPFVTQIGRSLGNGFSMMGLIANAQQSREAQEMDMAVKQNQMTNDNARTEMERRQTDEMERQGGYERGAGHQLKVDELAQQAELAKQQIAMQRARIGADMDIAARTLANDARKQKFDELRVGFESALAQYDAMSYTFTTPEQAHQAFQQVMDTWGSLFQAAGYELPRMTAEDYVPPTGTPAPTADPANPVQPGTIQPRDSAPVAPGSPVPTDVNLPGRSTPGVPTTSITPEQPNLAPGFNEPVPGIEDPANLPYMVRMLMRNPDSASPENWRVALIQLEDNLRSNPNLEKDRGFMRAITIARAKQVQK